MILLADLHLKEETADLVAAVLDATLEAAQRHGDSDVAILGDLLTLRHVVPVKLMNLIGDALSTGASQGIHWYLLAGNHDQVDYRGRNALECFGGAPYVDVYTDPAWNRHGLWVPHRYDAGAILESIRIPRAAGKEPGVLFAHQAIPP